MRLRPELQREKTVKYNFEIVKDSSSEKLAEGYVTVVCVDAQFKSAPIPDAIRKVIDAQR